MLKVHRAYGILAVCMMNGHCVFGENYPTKPLRIVCSEAGASNDFLSRIIAQDMAGPLGQQVIVDNRSSTVVASLVARAAPDGYTLLVITNIVWVLPFLQTAPYDPIKDFAPVTLAVSSPSVIVVYPGVAVNSIKELIDLAKAKPGELNYGSGSNGGAPHLSAELFKAMAGINIVRVPYNGNGPAITALIGGQIQVVFATASSVSPHIKSGRVRALAITTARPSLQLPNVPTVAASGLPGYEFSTVNVVFTPANTPAAIINRLNQEIVKALTRPDTKEKLFNAGMDVIGNSPAQTAVMIKDDMAKMGKLIKDAGIHVD